LLHFIDADQSRIIPHGICFREVVKPVVDQRDAVQPIQDCFTDIVSADIKYSPGQRGRFGFRWCIADQYQDGNQHQRRQYEQAELFFAFHLLYPWVAV
jgi:hypothetical protein